MHIGHRTRVHGFAREEQYTFGCGLVAFIYGGVPPDELVILSDDLARLGVGEARVKSHRRAAVGDEFGDGRAGAGAFVFAESEEFAAGGAANVARLQRAFAEEAVLEVGEKGAAAGAVPKIFLILRPEVGGQLAAFVGGDLPKAAEVIPLTDDEARLE